MRKELALKSKTEKSSLQTAMPLEQLERTHVLELLDTRRFCYFVGVESFVEGKGWRPSIVFENEAGHFPNGGGDVEPWYWGHDYKGAQEICRKKNLDMGVDEEEVNHIVASSMSASGR